MVPADQVGETQPSDPNSPQGNREGNRGGGDWEQRGLGSRAIEQRARSVSRSRQQLVNSFRRVIGDVAERVIRREANDVRRAINKYLRQRSAPEFTQWLNDFYNEHREFWQRQILPVLLSYADQVGVAVADELGGDADGADAIRAFIDAFVEALASRNVGQSQGIIQTLLERAIQDGEDPADRIEEQLDRWQESRAEQVARKESVFAGNAFAKAFYVLAGVTALRWVATGDSCPYCRHLDGKVVGIQKFFLSAGTSFEPDGADRPLKPGSNIGHPPVHDGCDCSVVAELG